MNKVNQNFKHGINFKCGDFCIIEEGVEIGNNVELKNYVELRKGTIIGNNCYLDSYVRTSGDCIIGNNVTIRFGATVCKQATIASGVFISPNVMMIYSDVHGDQPGIQIGRNVYIGTGVIISAGVKISSGVVVAEGSIVRQSCIISSYLYAGNPALPKKEIRESRVNQISRLREMCLTLEDVDEGEQQKTKEGGKP